MSFAYRIPALTEADADRAFLALSKLRDRLVWADENIAACHVERAIECVENAIRELRIPPASNSNGE